MTNPPKGPRESASALGSISSSGKEAVVAKLEGVKQRLSRSSSGVRFAPNSRFEGRILLLKLSIKFSLKNVL